MWEFLFDAVAGWALEAAPRSIRIGCTVLLLAAVAGLLVWAVLA